MSFPEALKQPKPFYLVFFIELWERFGYYGMQALIVLYFVKELNFSDSEADHLFAAFAALIYLLPSLGGYIGDRVLGTKNTMILGTLVLIVGYAALAVAGDKDIYLPLGIIAVGVGLFKANPASLLSKIYEGDATKLDGGFTLYYMAINIGSFFSMSLTPIFAGIWGWHAAFGISALGLCLAMLTYFILRNLVKTYGSQPDFEKITVKTMALISVGTIALIALSSWLLKHYTFSGWLILLGGVVVLFIFLSEIKKSPANEKRSLILCLILIIQAIIFFVLYLQMPTSLNLFALRNVEHHLWGIPIEPASYQVFNSAWIMILSPVLAMIYNQLAYRNRDLSIPMKFALGTFCTGISFMVLSAAIHWYSHDGIISGWWVVLFYFFEGAGELLVSALGLAMMSRFVPQRLMGFTMGAWFLCTSIAGIIAGHVASMAAVPREITDPVQSMAIYYSLFIKIGIITIAISLVMAMFVPALKRLTR
ncbi:MAG: MFS transporter [Gammaproteobacteria bacterium]|nr:MFS transporter [Gammaproteobacteria bacterium]